MEVLRRGKSRRTRRATLVALGTSIALLVIAGRAGAETITLGPDLTGPGETALCSPAIGGGCGEMLLSTSLPAVQTVAPADGTIVRWRIKGASAIPGYSLDVLRHNSDGSYTMTASTGSLTPAGNELETLAASLPILAGEYIELNIPQSGEFTVLPAASTYVTFFPPLEPGETRLGNEFEYPFIFGYNADVEYEPPSEGEPAPGNEPTPTPVPTTPAAAPPAAIQVVEAHCIPPRLDGMKLRTARQTVKAAHCALGKNIRRKGANNRNGKVVAQTKEAGTTLAPGSVLRVTLGRGQ
jgi:hypothetical protein